MTNSIAILATDFAGGGVSRMLVNLANGFAAQQQTVIFFVENQHHVYLSSLAETVELIILNSSTHKNLLKSLVIKLEHLQPEVMLSGMLADHQLALDARRKSQFKPRLFFRSGTNYLEEVFTSGLISGWKKKRQITKLYRSADSTICVSRGVAEGLSKLCSIPLKSIHVLKNPTVTPELMEKSQMPIDHPWFGSDELPVILGVGSLSRRKNFELLIRAFALVRKEVACRLVIIGDGKRKDRLIELAQSLSVVEYVQLLGFIDNPYPYMKAASLFVLSSNREGSPNVLVEAMATGTPVVSTDCPSGPQEILKQGEYGDIVPMNDEAIMAKAIVANFKQPKSKTVLQEAVEPYYLAGSCSAYIKAFQLS